MTDLGLRKLMSLITRGSSSARYEVIRQKWCYFELESIRWDGMRLRTLAKLLWANLESSGEILRHMLRSIPINRITKLNSNTNTLTFIHRSLAHKTVVQSSVKFCTVCRIPYDSVQWESLKSLTRHYSIVISVKAMNAKLDEVVLHWTISEF